MCSTTATPATTPIPVQLSDSECTALLLPHLSMPKQGPKCTLGYHRVFTLILRLLYTGMPWQCVPVPTDPDGKPVLHDTTVYNVFATWADDGSLRQAFVASVQPLAVEKLLDLSVLPGDGTNTVAQQGAMAWATRATHIRRGSKASPSLIIRAPSERRSPWLRSMRPTWPWYRRACKR